MLGGRRSSNRALAPWRKPRTVHDPGKVLLEVALATALGGDCLADVAILRAEADVFGPVASDPTVSRLIDVLAAAGPKALTAIRTARAEVRTRVWELAGEDSPAAGGSVIVDIDGVLVSHTPRSRTPPRPGRRPSAIIRSSRLSTTAQPVPGNRWLRYCGLATRAPTPRAITSPPLGSPWPNSPDTCGGDGRH
jgi:hypothetical protein